MLVGVERSGERKEDVKLDAAEQARQAKPFAIFSASFTEVLRLRKAESHIHTLSIEVLVFLLDHDCTAPAFLY